MALVARSRPAGFPSWLRSLVLLVGTSALLGGTCGLAAAGPAGAEPAWAGAIRAGIADQDREIARSSPQAVVQRLESRVARDSDVVTLYLLARAYGKKKDWASAVATYGDAIKAEPACWFAWRDRGVVKAFQRLLGPAEADLAEAVRLRPDYVDALQPLAEIRLEGERWDEGIALLQRVLDAEPANEPARIQIVRAERAAGRPDGAMRALAPLLSKSPSDPSYRFLEGKILEDKHDWKGAQALFKQLILDNPTAEAPLRAWIGVSQASHEMDRDEAIWVLERLLRLVKVDAERKKLAETVQRLRTQPASGAEPRGMPTPAQFAEVLAAPDAEGRARVLSLLLLQPRAAKKLVLALIERLDPAREPVASNRQTAVAIFGYFPSEEGENTTGREYGALLRGMLGDSDAEVRAKAADVLADIGARAEIPALVAQARGKDTSLALAARSAVYRLANAAAPEAAETPEAQAAAFEAWWKSPDRADLKVSVAREVLASADPAPEDMLRPLLLHETDARVWGEAYRGLRVVAADTAKALETATSPAAKARGAWMRTFPAFPDSDLVDAGRTRVLEAFLSWLERRP